MNFRISTELGSLIIEDSVIANIAGASALESYGIVGMAARNATDGIFELLKMDYLSKGIYVHGEDELIIDLHVILEYGINISTVAENIIERVKFNVETLTSLKVASVNIFVEGIRVEK